MLDPKTATRQEVDAAVKAWREARAARLDADKAASKLKEVETALKESIIGVLRAQLYEGTIVDGRATGVTIKQVPQCSEREQLEQFILSTGSLDLLQFRLSPAAIKERMEAGVEVPGIEWVDTFDLYDRKA